MWRVEGVGKFQYMEMDSISAGRKGAGSRLQHIEVDSISAGRKGAVGRL